MKITETKSKRLILKIISGLLVIFFFQRAAVAQVGQINIPRIQQMQNLPAPYLMRNWKEVAIRYDSFVYATNAAGQYLPLIHLKPAGINYPALQPILFDSYVGVNGSGSQAEAVNVIPSLVGASLVGIDKSNQSGTNWVIKAKDFFNKANGQNVYLNGYAATTGGDWWYDLMPNVFFYQLYSQYPATQDFNEQFTTIADRWLGAVHAMGGSSIPWHVPQMDYRAFNLSTMLPNTTGVSEPESAGTIGWLLYHAYLKTGDKKYLEGAQLAMSFLSGLNYNPAYEIQLPYGTFIAAKMNAELGTHYNIEKMVNWSFDQSSKRNWGTIVGTWGGSDVSGLVGEVDNPATGYAFLMNGFEQAAALVPMVKYDKRFARDIAKWTLNMANASRLFYSQYVPSGSQDDFAWSSTHDPHSVIAYEGLKQNKNSINLYATGDAKGGGWGQTNLGLYGSSHVGYLAALLQTTDVNGILLLDVNKTDFFGQNTFPSYLVYNPGAATTVTLPLGAQTVDIYDAISETILHTGATGNYPINAPAGEVMLLVYLPAGSVPEPHDGKLFIGNSIVDYHYGYSFTGKLRIRSLAAQDTLVEYNHVEKLYSSVENITTPAIFNWYVNGTLALSSPDSIFSWTVPEIEGQYNLVLNVTSGAASAKDSLRFHVIPRIPVAPDVTGITSDSSWYTTGQKGTLICHATNADGSRLHYAWTVFGGSIIDQIDSLIHWTTPLNEGLFNISCRVTNKDDLTTTVTQGILVKMKSQGITNPLAYYPLDGDARDYSGNGRNGVLSGVLGTTDARGEGNKAYQFSGPSDIIYVSNDAGLNFQNQITLSFWLRVDAVTQESYVLSHGSYEERWKVSVLADGNLRWTVKTNTSTKDLDSSFPLALNTYYHFAVVYTGYSMELYVNGQLDTFVANAGPMSTTSKQLTFGRKDFSTTNYHLRGSLDEVRIYDKGLAPDEILKLKAIWNAVTAVAADSDNEIIIYPNPSRGNFYVTGLDQMTTSITLLDVTGRKLSSSTSFLASEQIYYVQFPATQAAVIFVKIETRNGVVFRKIISNP